IGSSDLIGWFPLPPAYGRHSTFLAIEVKSKKGVIRKEQILFIKAVKDAGGIAFIARSIEDVRKELGGL
ncbi:MAG: VRR-NUC domain-containing protein, partial [Chloroflexi bacterium]|nr:VRR-NUC domain-containing protein [Chloroflexota bacterium]